MTTAKKLEQYDEIGYRVTSALTHVRSAQKDMDWYQNLANKSPEKIKELLLSDKYLKSIKLLNETTEQLERLITFLFDNDVY